MRKAPFTLCVVGGGFTGAAIAIACLQRITAPFRLVMIEHSPQIGRGVAYGSHHPLHLLNVRARDLSIRASQPGDFLNWAFRQLDQGENQAGLHEALAHTFLPRQLFGEYVRQRLYESVAQRPDVVFSVVNDTAKSCVTESGRYRIGLERNAPVIADVLFLATAYGLSSASAEGALKPFESVAPDRLAAARQIALIGSGLTMVDVLLARAPRRLSRHRTGRLAPRTIAAAACAERRRAERDRAAALEARLVACRGDPHFLRDGRGKRHAVASGHQRLAPVASGHLASLARR